MEKIDRDHLVIAVVVMETTLLVVSCFIDFVFKLNTFSKIYIDLETSLIAICAAIILFLINIVFIFVLPKFIKYLLPLRKSYDEVSKLMTEADFIAIILIALLSGFAEEFCFRGVFTSLLGLTASSVLFGFVHVANKQTIPYGIYCVFIGFYLGGVMIYTNSLWAPILVHIINNAVAIPVMQMVNRKNKPD